MKRNEDVKDLTTLIWEGEKKKEIIQEVDILLGNWQDLSAEDQAKRLSFLLPRLSLLDKKDQKICVDRLVEGRVVSRKDAEGEIKRGKAAFGVEDESSLHDKQPIYTAYFSGLVDLVEQDGEPAFLIKESDELSVAREVKKDGAIFVPPSKDQIPWLLPQAENILEYYKLDKILGNRKADSNLYDDLFTYHKGISELPSEEYYDLLVTWDFHTYLLEPFRYSPMICFFAVPERGKSRTGEGMIYLAYRGIRVESLRDGYLVRVAHDLHAALFFDVKDIWRKAEKNGTEDILLHRFERGAKVPRVLYPERGAHRDIVYYGTFGATIISTNEAVHHILETRAVQINMPETDRRFENDVTPEAALPLKERLVAFRARHLGESFPSIPKPASGRLGDILRPVQQIIRLVKPEREESFFRLIKELEEGRLMEKADSLEAQILRETIGLEGSIVNGILPIKDITDALNSDRPERQKFTYQRIGRRLSAMGLKKARTGDGASAIIWDQDSIERMKEKYGILETSETQETSVIPVDSEQS